MKKLLLGALMLLSACTTAPTDEWELVWEEDFNQPTLDQSTWTRIPRGQSDWNNYMSTNDACFELKDGNLILKGIRNPDLKADTATYLTGGVYTKGKRAFYGGKLEIRAKLQAGKGVWPAFWLMPFEECKWPDGGEIDIMERLNHDTIAYQTIHSDYTFNQGFKDNPPHYSTAPIKPDSEYNVFGVELGKDSLVFSINGVRNFAYPRIETDKQGQYPFDKAFYLLIDMQIGGSWVGWVDPADIPVEMEIDWVRYYKKAE